MLKLSRFRPKWHISDIASIWLHFPESTREVQFTSSRAWSGAAVFVVVGVVLFGLLREMTSELWTGIISNCTHALRQVTLLLPLGHLLQWKALPVVSGVPDD